MPQSCLLEYDLIVSKQHLSSSAYLGYLKQLKVFGSVIWQSCCLSCVLLAFFERAKFVSGSPLVKVAGVTLAGTLHIRIWIFVLHFCACMYTHVNKFYTTVCKMLIQNCKQTANKLQRNCKQRTLLIKDRTVSNMTVKCSESILDH